MHRADEANGVRHDFRITKVRPDGKCMFRALASGMSYNQGYYIAGSEEEEADAGERTLEGQQCFRLPGLCLVITLTAPRAVAALCLQQVCHKPWHASFMRRTQQQTPVRALHPADALRLASADALCRSASRRGEFKEAVYALETEDTLGGCDPRFWRRG